MKSRKLLLTAILGVVLAATIGTTPPGLAEDSSEQKYFQKTGITFEDPPGQPKITRQDHYVVIDADTGEYILAISRGKIDEPAPVPPWAKTGTN